MGPSMWEHRRGHAATHNLPQKFPSSGSRGAGPGRRRGDAAMEGRGEMGKGKRVDGGGRVGMMGELWKETHRKERS